MLHLSTQWENRDGWGEGGANASLIHSWRIVWDVFVNVCLHVLFVCVYPQSQSPCHLQPDCYFDHVTSPATVCVCLSLKQTSRHSAQSLKSLWASWVLFLSRLSPLSPNLSQSHEYYADHICGTLLHLNVLIATSHTSLSAHANWEINIINNLQYVFYGAAVLWCKNGIGDNSNWQL